MNYVKIKIDHPFSKKGFVLEHRLVVEKFIGRYLKPEEVVHHINEIKNDNRIGNLFLFPNQKEHKSFENKVAQFGMTGTTQRQVINRWDEYFLNKNSKKEVLNNVAALN